MTPIVYATAAAFIALGAYALDQTLEVSSLQVELSAEKTARSKDNETLAEDARKEAEALRRDLAQAVKDQRENERAQLEQVERVRADAAAAGDASVRLWKRYAAATAASCGRALPGPAPVSAGGASAPAPDLSADVPRRIDEAAGQLADFAELAFSRSVRCRADYNAVERASASK